MTLRDDLIRDEGIRLRPYTDTVGKVTIGIGRNLDDVGISESEAVLLLDNDIAAAEGYLDKQLSWWRTKPTWVQRGMANMCFQLGIHGLMGFRIGLKCLEASDYAGAQAAFRDSLWAKQTPSRAERVIALFSETAPNGIGGTNGTSA